MKLEIFGKVRTYRLLNKLEFTSDRKKMTVIVQDEESGQIILFCKGADLAIFDRLSLTMEQPFLDATKEDLIKFSTKGFRTLCFAMRILDEDYYKDWSIRFDNSRLELIKMGLGKLKTEGE
jgi:phospholipid-translocating ATPase